MCVRAMHMRACSRTLGAITYPPQKRTHAPYATRGRAHAFRVCTCMRVLLCARIVRTPTQAMRALRFCLPGAIVLQHCALSLVVAVVRTRTHTNAHRTHTHTRTHSLTHTRAHTHSCFARVGLLMLFLLILHTRCCSSAWRAAVVPIRTHPRAPGAYVHVSYRNAQHCER